MIQRFLCLIAFLALLLSFSVANGQTCSAPEISPSVLGSYNRLVCEGIELQQKDEFPEALAKIEMASKLPFDESVNFDLFPRLAILSYRLGNRIAYQDYLLRSKYALEVFYGFIQCDWDYPDDPRVGLEELYKRGDVGLIRAGERLEGPIVEEMYYHMCQGIMEFVYKSPTDLDEFLNDGIVRLYMEARSLGGNKEP